MTNQTPASSRPTITVEQMLDLAPPEGDRPPLGRLEVGVLARKKLTEIAAAPKPPWHTEPLGALYGVPVMQRDDFDPRAWRLLDTNGEIINEGTL